jgi:hypothetical protein
MARDALQGKWNITVTPDDDAQHAGAKEFKDTLVFKGGTFTSTATQKYGFESGPYDEEIHPGSVGGFTAAQTSKTGEGTTKWGGFVAATELTGTLEWKKKDGTVMNYSFKGSKE